MVAQIEWQQFAQLPTALLPADLSHRAVARLIADFRPPLRLSMTVRNIATSLCSAWQSCPEAVLMSGGEVVAVQWLRQVDADACRGVWGQAQTRFSPFTGWPPPRRAEARLRFADREADLSNVALALVVVSSRWVLWEAQAQIVDFCTHTESEPAPSWRTVAGLDPSGESWREREGIAGFLARTQLAVPPGAVTAAARLMSEAFAPPTLDGLGYVVAGMAAREGGPDMDECEFRCGREDWVCLLRCIAGG